MASTKELRAYLKAWVTVAVKGGFDKQRELARDIDERVQDELGEEDAALTAELRRHARALFDKQRALEATWKKRTTNDAIDAAFTALNRAGIIALQNAGYTMSDGWEDVNELARARKSRPRGATFYHGQDLERGVAGQGLCLAFGAYEDDKKKHEAASLAVARDVVDVLARHGVKAEWDGTVDRRVRILPFRWKRRRFTKAPRAAARRT
jgi:hypothetical protein